jgi:hypothetical protein
MRLIRKKTDWRTSFPAFPAALALVGLAWVLSMLNVNAASAQPAGGARQGPPPEALAACKSLASGAACSFSGPRGTVAGTCFAPPQGQSLACRPKDAPAPGGGASGPRP